MKDVSVILPTYNEAGNIKLLIEEIIKNLSNKDHEIIVVDDDSTDGTAEIASQLAESNQNIKVFVRKGERGLASAIRYGIERSTGKNVSVMDTDFNHPPGKIPELLHGLDDYDLVIGSRYIKGGGMSSSKLQFELSRLLNLYIGLVLNTRVKDNTCGFFAIKRDVIDKLPLGKIFFGYGDYFFRLLYNMKGFKIKEIPVVYGIRKSGETKTRVMKMGYQYGVGALKTRFKH